MPAGSWNPYILPDIPILSEIPQKREIPISEKTTWEGQRNAKLTRLTLFISKI